MGYFSVQSVLGLSDTLLIKPGSPMKLEIRYFLEFWTQVKLWHDWLWCD